MKPEIKSKVAAEFEAANFFSQIPAEIDGYTLKKILADDGDKFFYFAYENETTHRSLKTYFHEETKEYKVLVAIGLAEFCLTEFFTEDFETFTKILAAELDATIKKISAQIDPAEDYLIADKNFSSWQYGQTLKKNLEGFELFIAPKNPVKITNGSYIIINYSDFENFCDLNIFYNVYGDNFSGEAQFGGVQHPLYIFDAVDLTQLENLLKENLLPELKKIREEIFPPPNPQKII